MASQFSAGSTVTYDVAIDGTTTVTHDITLKNNTSDFYATSYTLSLTGINPIDPAAYEGGQKIPTKVSQKYNNTSIEVDFSDAVVGKDNKREFSIVFRDKTIVNRNGEIWEISTPRLSDSGSFDFYSSILKVPNSFGQLAYISPTPVYKTQDSGKAIFDFDKNASLNSPITAAFGQFQVFSFDLSYHLENPLGNYATTTIALPPDTNYQKMNYTQINPKPDSIKVDKDGNWIAQYSLSARQKMDVKIKGAVQLFASPLSNPKSDSQNLSDYLKPTELWQTQGAKIRTLANELKTPRAIYDYVSKNLTYDYTKVEPNVKRLGAEEALSNPKSAICTEFTDLFVALARAAHIPAREVEGFAYTENPQIEPLSLVADVLHAWPEYWDVTKSEWIPVDPTWGSTSGVDYFNKLDLRHFAFVIHGEDDKKPYPAGSYKLGANPQKDVNVVFGQLPTKRASVLTIENSVLSQLPFSDEIVRAKVVNSGPVAVYNAELGVMYDNSKIIPKETISVIPPFASYETNIDVPYGFLGQNIPNKVELMINGREASEFETYRTFVTISNLLLLSLFVFSIVFLIYLRFRDARKK